MSDFVLQFGGAIHSMTADLLRKRPGLREREIDAYSFEFGQVVVQRSADIRYDSYRDDKGLWIAIGRPIFLGDSRLGEESGAFCRRLSSLWSQEGARGVFDRLSGMYVVLRVGDDSVDVITDLMGIRPVYEGKDRGGRIVTLGSFVEAVACGCDRLTDFDRVSLGELLVYKSITFPYTSRCGIRELDPGSIHRYSWSAAGEVSHSVEVVWRPTEPDECASESQLGDDLESAIRQSAEDITRDVDRAAVTLSGGRDSRLILAALPEAKRAGAITFVTRENRETEVARQIAESLGVPQYLAHRDPEFYADLLKRGTDLLGTELRADAHGLCIIDNHLQDQFDVIIGGQLSDTYLKDHFMPRERKESLRHKGVSERMKGIVRGVLGVERLRPIRHRVGVVVRDPFSLVGKDIVEEMVLRRRRRMEEVREVRPRSAEEWINFWPTSRQNDTSHILGNSRIYSADGLFMHRHVIETAIRLPDEFCYRGRLANEIFARVYKDLAKIVNANTGLPAGASMRQERHREKKMWRDRKAKEQFSRLSTSAHPWNDVQSSWVDFELMQKMSPRWQSYRAEITSESNRGSEEAMMFLRGVITEDPVVLLSQYHDEWGVLVNRVAMQIAIHAAKCFTIAGTRNDVCIAGISSVNMQES